ncbi:MAG: hypothetical protein JOZ85_18265 [Betaproteobacteria bacterium]|nr:hypothetical protein [Betaproteobacteria bacterium]
MVDRTYREQYLDAVSVYVRDQEVAGLDIVTDGDCRFDADVAGHNWFSYAPLHMDGFGDARPYQVKGGLSGIPTKPGHILHDVLETRLMPDLVGPVGRGKLRYTPTSWSRFSTTPFAACARRRRSGAIRAGVTPPRSVSSPSNRAMCRRSMR